VKNNFKILIDGQIFGIQKFGGISRYFIELFEQFRKMELNIHIKCLISRNHYLYQTGEYGISIPTKYKYLTRIINTINIFYIWLLSFINSYNVIHLTFYNNLLIYFKPRAKKVVLTVYDFIDEKDPKVNNKSAIKSKYNTMKIADSIICISNNTRKDLIELYPEFNNKARTIHFGFNDFNIKYEFDTDVICSNYVLFVGQRDRYKNFDLLVSAINLCVDSINIVAFGPPPTKDEENRYSQKNIYFVSGDDNKLANYYKKAICFVFPSSYEGFGIPSLEAMSMNCPIIVPDSSCFPEIVEDAGLYFECGNANSLSSHIFELHKNQQLREELIKKGRIQFTKFTYEKCATETLRLYKE
jgi:glycosyltransferase involved in cell wall biosynthesis